MTTSAVSRRVWRAAPHALAALVTSVIVWYAWGRLDPTPILHDEAAYLFQAQTLANFRLSYPSPPTPEFFEQFHVLVTPTFAARYPPGFGALVVPGVWLGLPALIPVVLAGVTAACLFALTRRHNNAGVAAAACAIWLGSTTALGWSASYLSQTATTACWWLGWLSYTRWRETTRGRWVVITGLCAGWMAIARPLTALAYAAPLGVLLLLDLRSRKRRGPVTAALGVFLLVLLALPISNHAVLGGWTTTPWSEWARQYAPSERLGFGEAEKSPAMPLSPELAAFNRYFAPIYRAHTAEALPRLFADRLTLVVQAMFGGYRVLLAAAALVGVLSLGRDSTFALATALLLVIIYLPFGHAPWALYYAETLPLLAYFSARGLDRVVGYLLGQSSNARAPGSASLAAGALWAAILGALAIHVVMAASAVRASKAARMAPLRQPVERAQGLPGDRIVVFVRYGRAHSVHQSLIANAPDLAKARIWFVHDRGADNDRLLSVAPDRRAYVFDEESDRFVALAADASREAR